MCGLLDKQIVARCFDMLKTEPRYKIRTKRVKRARAVSGRTKRDHRRKNEAKVT